MILVVLLLLLVGAILTFTSFNWNDVHEGKAFIVKWILNIIAGLLLMFASQRIEAQPPQYDKSLYAIFLPGDVGIGLRYDQYFDKLGIYTTGSYGHYSNVLGEYTVKQHIRASIGGTAFLPYVMNDGTYNVINLGLVYHHYGDIINMQDPDEPVPKDDATKYAFFPVSVEIGIGGGINRFNFAVIFDVIKFEGIMCFGIRF